MHSQTPREDADVFLPNLTREGATDPTVDGCDILLGTTIQKPRFLPVNTHKQWFDSMETMSCCEMGFRNHAQCHLRSFGVMAFKKVRPWVGVLPQKFH